MNTIDTAPTRKRETNSEPTLIRLSGICRTYGTIAQPVIALQDLDLTISAGEFVAIMGASGSGKSTLMNIIGCLDRPSSGSYFLDGEDVSSCSEDELASLRNRYLGFVFQQFNLLSGMTALENVMLPLVYADVDLSQRRIRAERALRLLGLGDRLKHRPHELSGGQQQRVSIARALVNNPKVLLADEPTGALDSKTSSDIMELLKKLNNDGTTIVMVTHDKDIASNAARLIRLKDGQIISDKAMEQVRQSS